MSATMLMTEFERMESDRLGIGTDNVRQLAKRGQYLGLRVRRIGGRLHVTGDAVVLVRKRRQYVNGVPTKVWVAEEAARLGIKPHNLQSRLSRGSHRYPREVVDP